MPNNPAILISDEMGALLEKEAMFQSSFGDLAETQHPWEVTPKILKEIQNKLLQTEKSVRKAYPDQDITCIISGMGAYWLPQEGLDKFLKEMKIPLKKLQTDGPLPVWKLTTAELISSHISNMRRLLLTACHDLILLEQLKESLGENHGYLQREFELCERNVRKLLEEIAKQGPNLTRVISQNFMLIDRVRITEEMLEKGEISAEQLGYSLEELQRAEKVLEERCNKELPAFRQRLQAVFNQTKDALRDGESTQLIRAARWEMAFSMMGTPPKGFQGYSMVSEMERKGMSAMVTSREEEMGSSEMGKSAMKATDEVREMKGEKTPEPEPDEPQPSEEEKPQDEETAASKKKREDWKRMAFQTRRR